MVTRSLTLLAAACLVTAAFADGVINATKMPENIPTKHVHVTVGPDGIGRVDSGVGVQASSTNLPLYSVINAGPEGDSGYYFPAAAADGWTESIGIPAPAQINEIVVWYYDGSGAGPTDTVDLDLLIYDATADDDSDIFDQGCSAIGGLALAAYTIPGLPQDSGFSWIVTIDVSAAPTIVAGRIWVQHGYYNHTFGAGNTTGPILMNGGDGVPLGRYVQYTRGNYAYQNGPSVSDNVMYSFGLAGCYWFGGNPRANFSYAFNGQYAFRGELAGDFGLLGGVPAFPQNTCYVTVTDSSGFAETNLVYLYGPNGNEFSLPFNSTGPFDIRVEAFNGYLSRSLFGVTPDPVGFTTTGVFNLRAGDANYDNTVNIADLNTVLINFGQSGN